MFTVNVKLRCLNILQPFSPQSSGVHPAPQGFAPSKAWQKDQAASFSVLRQVRLYGYVFQTYLMLKLYSDPKANFLEIPRQQQSTSWFL